MQIKHSQVGIGLWLLWVLVSTVGFAFGGFAFHFPFGFPVGTLVSFDPGAAIVGFVQGTLTGVVIGTLQWLVLRRWFSGAGWWVLATAVGVAVVHAIGDAVPSPVAFWMIALPSGVVIGILQGLVLRRLGYRSGLWIAASMVSWYVGLTLGIAVAYTMGFMLLTGPGGWARQHAVVGTVAGVVIGVATGFLLVWLLRHPVSKGKAMEPVHQV